MCSVCETVRKNPPKTDEGRAVVLATIGEAARIQGVDHFRLLLDRVLGTEASERDPEVEAAWERGRRP